MYEIMQAFPNATAFREASVSQVAFEALKGIIAIDQAKAAQRSWLPPSTLIDSISNPTDVSDVGKRIASEAVSWLTSHDLIAEIPLNQGSTIIPTRLGLEIASALKVSGGLAVASRAVDLIPASVRSRVLPPLVAGDFDLAVTAAFKTIEVRMRERASLPTSDFGSRLARRFFERTASTTLQRPDRKDLSDERHLFEGLFGLYRDRAVHEAPHIDSVDYALEIVISAAHLLRIVEAATIT